MKRITLFVLFFLILASSTSFVFALDDYTPSDDSYPEIPDELYDYITPEIGQTVAAISRIESRLQTLDRKLDDTMKKQDIEKFKYEVDEHFEMKIGQILGKMLALLLVWQVFLFATLFLAKSKGWL